MKTNHYDFKQEVFASVLAITAMIASKFPIPMGLRQYSEGMQELASYQFSNTLHRVVDGVNSIWHACYDRNYVVNYNEDKSRYKEEMVYHQCFSIELPQRDMELLVIDVYIRKEDSYLFFDWQLATNVPEHRMDAFEPVEELA